MLLNYFKTAYRNLLRYKGYTLINISGLAISIAASLLLFLIVRYELSYDTFRKNYENIYHIYTQDTYSDGISHTPGLPFPALEALRTDVPEVKFGAICSSYGNQITVKNNKGQNKFVEEMGVFFADPEFFDVIEHKWLVGTPSLLAEPYTVVLSRSLAMKYFNDWQNVIGKTIKMDNVLNLRVVGIIEDAPFNSDFRLQLIGSYITLKQTKLYGYNTEWGSITSNFQIYLLFPRHLTQNTFEKNLAKLSEKYYKMRDRSKRINLVRPLKTLHFDTDMGNLGTHVMSRSSLMTLSLIGVLIIIMACINFINLSTAQSVSRSKEVGIRKVLGSSRRQLFWQMIIETKFIVFISSILALLIAWLMLPYIKHIIIVEEDLSLFNLQSLLFFLAILITITFLAGIYPSLILSGFKPVIALKNKINSTTIGGISLRRTLVVIQFAISQALIIGTIVAISQMNFIRNADLGFNQEAILLLQGSSDSICLKNQPAFKEALLKIPGVKSISFASDMPSSDNNSGTNFAFNHQPDESFTLFLKFGDEDYFKTFDLEFLAGKAYEKNDTTTDVVINETLLKRLNIASPEMALGKDIRTGGNAWRKICGVVKDFKTNSLREQVKPIMISSRRKSYEIACIKLHSQNLMQTQKEIQASWENYFPDYIFISRFMDEMLERFYEQEYQMALLYKIFAALAIFISCLGLYGLISFMVIQKTKEVGVRKVLGAGIGNILILFSKEFAILIVVAFLIAAPLAYYFMNEWLNNFVFRVNIGTGVFLIAVFTSLTVAFLAVSYKSLKAAIANPVKSLRSE